MSASQEVVAYRAALEVVRAVEPRIAEHLGRTAEGTAAEPGREPGPDTSKDRGIGNNHR